MRSKNALEKKKLDDSITNYNVVNRLLETDRPAEDVTSENALDGNFPWIDPQDNKGTVHTSIHTAVTIPFGHVFTQCRTEL